MTRSSSRPVDPSRTAYAVLFAAAIGVAAPAVFAGEHDHHQHQQQAQANRSVSRTTANYKVPDAPMVRMDGTKVKFGA
ncbi:MAG TPA: hypothetical protein VN279_14775, partial [Rhodocyclaceae bacterium]|nr:hypothetical protein [Rhodocyclaceae bacterium]